MTALISMELEALATDEAQLPSLNTKDSLLGSEPNSLGMNPCLDILLSENVLSHVLAASRDELTLRNCTYIFENIVFMEF